MSLDIWFAEDIRNALLAADEASTSTARMCAAVGGDQITLQVYLEGYRAALTTVALACGLAPQFIVSNTPQSPAVLPKDKVGTLEIISSECRDDDS